MPHSIATIACLIVLAGCWSGRAECPDCNVLLISIDTLRSDHLGCYGYPQPTSPNVDRFRQEGVLFAEVIAQAPSTLPSHASMLTSLLPSDHRASMAKKIPLAPATVTLAQILRRRGWATIAFHDGGQMAPEFGLGKGFDVYETNPNAHGKQQPTTRFRHAVARAIDWIEANPGKKFFLFLHTYEVHHPYTPAPELQRLFDNGYRGTLPDKISMTLLRAINSKRTKLEGADLAHIVHAYDAEIRSMDDGLGVLLDYLREHGLYDRTLAIFTSDHGEEFGEHGKVGWHSHTLYDELLRVPLIIKLPGSRAAGTTVEAQVRLIDLPPTITEVLGFPPIRDFSGASLLHVDEPRPAVSEQDARRRIESVRDDGDGWKWYQGKLFDLAHDPAEKHDVAREHPEVARRLAARLPDRHAARQSTPPPTVEPDPATREHLRTLGY